STNQTINPNKKARREWRVRDLAGVEKESPTQERGAGLRHEACNKRSEYDRPKTDTVQEDN
ncbi:TPA: hypothetical protein ACQWFK_001888, partial [Neisseria subflava]